MSVSWEKGIEIKIFDVYYAQQEKGADIGAKF
jgi:hypothetical protein